jgi:hypothetical protein
MTHQYSHARNSPTQQARSALTREAAVAAAPCCASRVCLKQHAAWRFATAERAVQTGPRPPRTSPPHVPPPLLAQRWAPLRALLRGPDPRPRTNASAAGPPRDVSGEGGVHGEGDVHGEGGGEPYVIGVQIRRGKWHVTRCGNWRVTRKSGA